MKRRKALKKLGTGLSAGLVLPTLPGWLSACKEEDPAPEIDYDGSVAVIGAGAAGLYAAHILKSKGIAVKIFEASGRIGGRIRSVQFNDSPVKTDFPIELGAERILGTDSLWAQIADQLTIPVVDLASSTANYYILDNELRDVAAVAGDADFLAAKNFFENLSTYSGADVSVKEAIQAAGINQRVHAILNSWIGNKFGTSDNRLGIKPLGEALGLVTRNNDERVLRSNQMESVLSSRFSAVIPQVEFNTVIKSIDYSADKIKLTGQKNSEGEGAETISVVVDKVIIAVPVSILKDGDISFIPSLPASKVSSLSRIKMDACVRVVLDFKQNFWADDSAFLFGGTEAPQYFNTGVLRSEFNKTLSITVNGPQAEKLSAAGADAAIQTILGELDAVFDGKGSLNIRKDDEGKIVNEYFDWTVQPFIKGGISYVTPGGTNNDRTVFAQPVNDLIFFAGEATDDKGDAGTINGALLSAERASLELIDSITGTQS